MLLSPLHLALSSFILRYVFEYRNLNFAYYLLNRNRYYLCRKGVPFREAHGLAGKAVALAEDKGCAISELTVDDYKTIHSKFDADVTDVWNFENSTAQYTATGGTSKSAVLEQIAKAKALIV